MEIRGATNRGNYREDNGPTEGRRSATGKINQTAGFLLGFSCDGSRVHDLWTPRHFRRKIHYILHLARCTTRPKVTKALVLSSLVLVLKPHGA